MTKKLVQQIIFILISVLFISGCARPENQQTSSQIKLQLPNMNSQKVNSLESCEDMCLHHLIVNVTGSGFQPIELSIDVEDLENEQLLIDVPNGSNRLFQVIAVYREVSTATLKFYYGDSVQSLNGGNKDIAIDIKSLNQSSSKQAQITGRWLGYEALPKTPTGELRVQYRPANGKPAMTIQKSSINSGWFSAFSLQGIAFDYVVKTLQGERILLFENASYESFTTSASLANIMVPTHYDDGKLEQPIHFLYGFYGSPAHTANKKICYNSSVATSLNNYDGTADGSQKISWSNLTFTGGENSFSSCGANSNFPFLTNEYIKVVPQFLSNDKSQSGGFSGVFAGIDSNSQMKFFFVDTTSFKTSVVPGGRLLADQAVLFSLPPESQDLFREGYVPCTEFAQGKFGAQNRGTVDLALAGETASGSHNLNAQEMNYPKALCPSFQGRIFNAGVMDEGEESTPMGVGVVSVVGNQKAFAALRSDGSVVTWGDSLYGGDSSIVASSIDGNVEVTEIYSTKNAFAVIRTDGSVVTWGDATGGGNSSSVANAINGTIAVTQIYSAKFGAFAALRNDGSVVTWGNSTSGGNSSSVASSINGTIDVIEIFSTSNAFAALRNDGSVVTWGNSTGGGDSSIVSSEINGTIDVIEIFSTSNAFAALRNDGSVVTWGNSTGGGDSSIVSSQINGMIDVIEIFSTSSAFAALKEDGSVVTWGSSGGGGNSSTVSSQIDGTIDVIEVYSTDYSFAALKEDGSVVTWGNSASGGNSSTVSSQIDGTIDVIKIYSSYFAFAALRSDGSVVSWGDAALGGDSSIVSIQINGTIDVTQIYSAKNGAFAALRIDGSVVTWGHSNSGGNSTIVSSQINGTIAVYSIYSTGSAFAALRTNGSVITWGDPANGGDSSSVAAKLSGY